jgi:hypothetical protein
MASRNDGDSAICAKLGDSSVSGHPPANRHQTHLQ